MMNINEAKLIPLPSVVQKFGKVTIREIPGGNAIDYVCAYLKATGEDCTEADALRWLHNMLLLPAAEDHRANQSLPPEWTLIRTGELEDLALIRYVAKRGIPVEVACSHFEETLVRNVETGKRMYTLGFASEDGGYALRNVFMKGHTGPNAITFKRGKESKPKAVHLFKDSFDYLSALLLFPQYVAQNDSIILNYGNDTALAFPYISGYGYQTLYSWMSNDLAGDQARQSIQRFAATQARLRHKSMTKLYNQYVDVNATHIANSSSNLHRDDHLFREK